MTPEFKPFPKLPRLSRETIITEKIDGTNASIFITHHDKRNPDLDVLKAVTAITPEFLIYAGSRTRWITPQDDNYGFACWVQDHALELAQLGPGHHFGEWWGNGIQRGYGLKEKRFSLFNTQRWALHGTEPKAIPTADPRIVRTQDVLPPCVGLVPVLYQGEFDTQHAYFCLNMLRKDGSFAVPGFMRPEGIVVFHVAGNVGFKKTIEKDHAPKGGQ
jgi:hypothetical protein